MRKKIRRILYRIAVLVRVPLNYLKKNSVSFTAQLNGGILNRSSVGAYSYIGPNTVINNASIGSYTSIAPGVQIGGMEHAIDWFAMSTVLSDRHISHLETKIGNNVWIAANAIIKQGVTIGDGSVVGAGAFVNKDVPANAVVVGIPAKIIRTRINAEMNRIMSEDFFWEKKPEEIIKIFNKYHESIDNNSSL